jgi:hypothetical protein
MLKKSIVTALLPGIFCLLAACATVDKGGPVSPAADQGIAEKDVQTGMIVFINKTPFTVHLKRGSGKVDAASIISGSSAILSNTHDQAEIYYPVFDIPLTPSYLITLPPSDINLYYQIDNHEMRQEIEISLPPGFNDSGVYIHFTNNSRTGGISLSRNEETSYMTGINFTDGKYNVNQGETIVYRENNPQRLQNLRINPGKNKFGELQYKPAHVYYFSFDGANVNFTDARPLHRVGESAWTRTIPNVTGPMPLSAADGEIHLFASTDKTVMRYVHDSAGNAKPSIASGDNFYITFAAHAGDGFFIAGYENETPIARIQGADGQTRRILEPSKKREYLSAQFYTAAQKDGSTWLVAGGGGAMQALGFTAYARLARDNGAALAADWELGGADFDAKTPPGREKCGEIRSAVYDPGKDRWLVTGELLFADDSSYIAVISGNGVIQKIDTSFRDMSFFKLLMDDSSGNYYAVGEEQKGNETRAVIIKYNAEGKELWRVSDQPAVHSYYQDAVLDRKDGQIVLGGVMRGKNGYGIEGIPFIEGVDIEKGTLLWREELKHSAVAGARLVTAIVPAPDYGFALALSGMAANGCVQPFIIVRVNARGKIQY